jgi:hypothetical protein
MKCSLIQLLAVFLVLAAAHSALACRYNAPVKIESAMCIGCGPANISVTDNSMGASSGWLPIDFEASHNQKAVTLQVTFNGKREILKLPTAGLHLIAKLGDQSGAILFKKGMINQFYPWPINVLHGIIPRNTTDTVFFDMGAHYPC